MADEMLFFENLRPVKGYKNVDQGVIRVDPWSPSTGPFSGGGTYEYPVVTRDDVNVYYLYRDGTGRPWIEIHGPEGTPVEYITTDFFDNPGQYGIPGLTPLNMGADTTYARDSYTGLGWRYAREGEEPLGRVESHVEESPPLEESTPLFGPGDQTPDPPDDPTGLPGHWDPVSLRWVNDEPTMKSAGILGHGHTGTRGESRPAADEDSSAADHKADLGDDVAGPLRSGHWDPAALRWVPDEPTSSVGRILDDNSENTIEQEDTPSPTDPWDQPREGQPTTMRSAGIFGDENAKDTQVPVDEGGAGGGVDPSVPFDPNATEGQVDLEDLIPYRDYIPFAPMVEDPSTGEWRNAEPGEIPGAEGGDEGQLPTPTGGEGEEEYQTQEVPPLQFGNTGNVQPAGEFPTPSAGGEGEEAYQTQEAPPLQFGNTGNLQNAGELQFDPENEAGADYQSQETAALQFGQTGNLQNASEFEDSDSVAEPESEPPVPDPEPLVQPTKLAEVTDQGFTDPSLTEPSPTEPGHDDPLDLG